MSKQHFQRIYNGGDLAAPANGVAFIRAPFGGKINVVEVWTGYVADSSGGGGTGIAKFDIRINETRQFAGNEIIIADVSEYGSKSGLNITVAEGDKIYLDLIEKTQTGNVLAPIVFQVTFEDGVVTGGEANTASNVGSSGINLFLRKTNANLEFAKIKAGNNISLNSLETGEVLISANVAAIQFIQLAVAASDESTAITNGSGKVVLHAQRDFSLTKIFAGLSTASSSGAVQIDVKKNGVSIFGANKLNVPVNLKTSLSANPQPDINVNAFALGDEIQIDVVSGGSGSKGLKIYLNGTIS